MDKITEIHGFKYVCQGCEKFFSRGEIMGVTFWHDTKWTEQGDIEDRNKPHISANLCNSCLDELYRMKYDQIAEILKG